MPQATAQDRVTGVRRFLPALTAFSLSAKMKYAIKAALSLVMVYYIAFSQGWSNVMTAATTIIFIAVTDSLGDSILKGMFRIIGTVTGAAIGMLLIALFPQERALYLISVSIIVTILLYLARAFRGDMIIFLLAAITPMTMFKNGAVDNVFLYGAGKTLMTVFGITVYTLVGVFLWPVNLKDTTRKQAGILTGLQHDFFLSRSGSAEESAKNREKILEQMEQLRHSVAKIGSSLASGLNSSQWQSVFADFTRINEILTVLTMHGEDMDGEKLDQETLSGCVNNYPQLVRETETLFTAVERSWQEPGTIPLPPEFKAEFDMEALNALAPLKRAALSSAIRRLASLHAVLRKLAGKLNALNSPAPTRFKDENVKKQPRFLWLDIEDLKGALLSLLIFWCATLFWITANPPAGFFIVTMATGLSVITTFSPVKPSMMIVVYSISFIFAILAYILVLPHLATGGQLAVFLLVYAFIGFYFIIPDLAALFLIGIIMLNITNEMYYVFDGFLNMLLAFYAFLLILLLFYYLPFSNKPEHLFLTLEKRFFALAGILIDYDRKKILEKTTAFDKITAGYARMHLLNTAGKMRLWATQIDGRFFRDLPQKELVQFSRDCESFARLLLILDRDEDRSPGNPLIRAHVEQFENTALRAFLKKEGGVLMDEESARTRKQQAMARIDQELERFFSRQGAGQYDRETMLAYYENLSLRKNILAGFLTLHDRTAKLKLNLLQETRF